MTVPNPLEIIIQEFLLVGATDLSDLGDDITSSNISFVFCHDTATILITVSLGIFGYTFFDVLVIVSEVFFLLNKALLFLLLLFFLSLFVKLCEFFLFFFFLLLSFNFIFTRLFFLLGVFWAVDPLDMSFGLIVFVHE